MARAAGRARLPYTLSTLSTRSIEEVAAVSAGPRWFQVYMWRDRGVVKELIERAAAAGYETLVLTVDLAVHGRRERDVRRGLTLPPKLGIGTLVDGALHPAWTWRLPRAEPIRFANVVDKAVGDGSDAVSLAEYIATQLDPSVSWADVDWIRSLWDGPLVIKGIQTIDDPRLAADTGAAAIALSNHGGRQLDSAPVPLDLVAPAVDAVGDRVEIICDGGVRRGSDIVKAVALGARACMAGHAYLYGLGAAGERGVDHVLALFAEDMRRTMALIGVPRDRRTLARTRQPTLKARERAKFANRQRQLLCCRFERVHPIGVRRDHPVIGQAVGRRQRRRSRTGRWRCWVQIMGSASSCGR